MIKYAVVSFLSLFNVCVSDAPTRRDASIPTLAATLYAPSGYQSSLSSELFSYPSSSTLIRGVTPSSPIQAGGTVVHVPQLMMVTTENVLEVFDVELGGEVKNAVIEGGPLEVGEQAILAAYIVRTFGKLKRPELDPSQPLTPALFMSLYVSDLLDTQTYLKRTPVFLNQNELNTIFPIDGSCVDGEDSSPSKFSNFDNNRSARLEIEALRSLAQSAYNNLVLKHLTKNDVPPFPFEDFLFAWMIVESRFWELKTPFPVATHAFFAEGFVEEDLMKHMAPVADLMNFGDMATHAFHEEEGGGFTIQTEEPLEVGTEVLFWYQDNCAEYFEIHYGFSDPINNQVTCEWNY